MKHVHGMDNLPNILHIFIKTPKRCPPRLTKLNTIAAKCSEITQATLAGLVIEILPQALIFYFKAVLHFKRCMGFGAGGYVECFRSI